MFWLRKAGTSSASFTNNATYTAPFVLDYAKAAHTLKCLQSEFHCPYILSAFSLPQVTLTFWLFIILLGRKQKAHRGLLLSYHPSPEGKRQWQRAKTKGTALAWRVCVPCCVVGRLCGSRAGVAESEKQHLFLLWGNQCLSNVLGSPALPTRKPWSCTLSAFQKVDGNDGTYGKPLEILATVDLGVFCFKILIIRLTMFLYGLCT